MRGRTAQSEGVRQENFTNGPWSEDLETYLDLMSIWAGGVSE